jgi:hypothetical protein
MNQPFPYCALRYLLLWEKSEKALHASMKTEPDTESLRKSMHYFRVSRTFREIDTEAKASFVLAALVNATGGTSPDPIKVVEQLTDQFVLEFEQRNLSAATKLLWLRHRRPFLIYDARAVSALKGMDYKFNPRSYSEYSEVWLSAYKKHRGSVLDAVALLPTLQPFVSAWHVTPESIDRLVQKPWFCERVFDIYLWERGQ